MTLFSRSYPTSLFPIYLLPSIPFPGRKRRSVDSTLSDSSGTSDTFPKAPTSRSDYLSGHVSCLRCARCATDLCLSSQIISKGFTGRHGRAYLVSPSLTSRNDCPAYMDQTLATCLANTHVHSPMPRQLVTGAHTVCDVSCAFCGSLIGWKYEDAEEESQKYKIGKYILETRKTFETSCWEAENGWDPGSWRPPPASWQADGNAVNHDAGFDSQDEDECEDLFAGVWSPIIAAKRRKGKLFGKHINDDAANGWKSR